MILQKNGRRKVSLLIGEYTHIENVKKMVLDSHANPLDPLAPACRFRGTIVSAGKDCEHITVVGWQRNVSRLRKMDVSLPIIITLAINQNKVIEQADLDDSFKGSKGLMCSWKYLNRNLKSELQGSSFDNSFFHKTKVKKMHCFHIFEVLSGIYSFFQVRENIRNGDKCPYSLTWEEEAIDSYVDNNTLNSLGVHTIGSKTPFRYRLTLHDIMNKVCFDSNGILKLEGGVQADFVLNGRHVLSDMVSINNPQSKYKDFLKFLFQCIKYLKPLFCETGNIRVFNTNLYPRAYIGMLIQSIAIRLFHNNYNYIMHALTSLQRAGDTPLCVGAVRDPEEAAKYFPGYNFSDLI